MRVRVCVCRIATFGDDKLFDAYDADGDGVVSAEEWKDLHLLLGIALAFLVQERWLMWAEWAEEQRWVQITRANAAQHQIRRCLTEGYHKWKKQSVQIAQARVWLGHASTMSSHSELVVAWWTWREEAAAKDACQHVAQCLIHGRLAMRFSQWRQGCLTKKGHHLEVESLLAGREACSPRFLQGIQYRKRVAFYAWCLAQDAALMDHIYTEKARLCQLLQAWKRLSAKHCKFEYEMLSKIKETHGFTKVRPNRENIFSWISKPGTNLLDRSLSLGDEPVLEPDVQEERDRQTREQMVETTPWEANGITDWMDGHDSEDESRYEKTLLISPRLPSESTTVTEIWSDMHNVEVSEEYHNASERPQSCCATETSGKVPNHSELPAHGQESTTATDTWSDIHDVDISEEYHVSNEGQYSRPQGCCTTEVPSQGGNSSCITS